MPAKKSKNIKRLLITWQILLLCLAVLLLAWLVWRYVDNKIEQNNKIERLSNASVLLDEVKKEYDAQNPQFEMKREAKCFRINVKFSEGSISCGQHIVVDGRFSSEEEDLKLQSRIKEILKEKKSIEFAVPESFFQNDNNRVVASGLSIVDGEKLSCGLEILRYGSETLDQSVRGNFEYKISCTESGLDSFIYPEVN